MATPTFPVTGQGSVFFALRPPQNNTTADPGASLRPDDRTRALLLGRTLGGGFRDRDYRNMRAAR